MHTLFLLRHAKSSWDDPAMHDIDRPLNARGIRAARFMGEFMQTNGLAPDVILSSPSKRTRMTVELLTEASHIESPIIFDDRIYEASLGDLVAVIDENKNSADTIMIVCHNPGIESLIRHLSGSFEPMPTAALAVLARTDNAEYQFSLENVYRPRELME